MRPCPLSMVVATDPAGGASGRSSGGKSGGEPPCLLLTAEPRSDVDLQRRLVVLDGEDVIAAGRDDLRADVPLAEQGVAGEDISLHRQDAQQLQGGLVLVGLCMDSQLRPDRLDFRAVGGDVWGAR